MSAHFNSLEPSTVRRTVHTRLCYLKNKGTYDWFGALPLDTPVFELRSVLGTEAMGDEATKLRYDLADQGGELASLRYDMTVQFARWLATNKDARGAGVKRYAVGKAYRRDQLFHRRVLFSLLAVAGVPMEKRRGAASAVDKLDKVPWSRVRRELVVDKGLEEEAADRVGRFVARSGGVRDMLEDLCKDEEASSNEDVRSGLKDYYTGLIFEAVVDTSSPSPALEVCPAPTSSTREMGDIQIGSLAAGGRYDDLVSAYTRQEEGVPCVGVSVGVDRVYALLAARGPKKPLLIRELDVYVLALCTDGVGGGGGGGGGGGREDSLLAERLGVLKQLWNSGLRADFTAQAFPSFRNQVGAAACAKVAVMLERREWERGTVRVQQVGEGYRREMGEKDGGRLVRRADVVIEVKKFLESLTGSKKEDYQV
ncbi:histidyl-tRNA synthetase [Xylariomycetidae sp. FL0641]|nr:histidyl-tRNA synthetase [Xylariomycetidae sp. FL0641]